MFTTSNEGPGGPGGPCERRKDIKLQTSRKLNEFAGFEWKHNYVFLES